MAGSKITKMTVGNLRFLDSCLLFQQKLSKLPAAYNFSDRVAKGHFPHLLNDGRNWCLYDSELPSPQMFGVETMQADDLKSFYDWYDVRKEDPAPWVFMEEIIKYCRNVVEVLLIAVMEYRHVNKSITGIDPTTRCFTLAGVAQETFRAGMLEKNAIGITPIEGYSGRKSSITADAWLDGEEFRLNNLLSGDRKIQREKGFGKYFADGFDPISQTVYEFWGCLWHGCECIYPEEHSERTMNGRKLIGGELRKQKQDKLDYYFRRGSKVIQVKECEFNQYMKPDSDKDFPDWNERKIKKHIRQRRAKYFEVRKGHLECDIRAAFFGGRTCNVAMLHECTSEEELKYMDFTSLYPDVLKNNAYPRGHPEVILGDVKDEDRIIAAVDNREYFGFVSCTVLPPQQAWFATLPARGDGTLLFPLCALCADTKNQTDCRHTDEERALTGTWVTEKLYLALDNGYKLKKIHQVLHYPEQDGNMFKAYIDLWLKIKQESSGWPALVKKEQEQAQKTAYNAEEAFIQKIYRTTGTLLTRQEIVGGPGWPPAVKVKAAEAVALARAAEDKYITE
ncbi:hypothetical protein HDE_10361 [Halotydeus destructor]|nr:hypothetical protein HDE_10361 [Halotydeus destructor]